VSHQFDFSAASIRPTISAISNRGKVYSQGSRFPETATTSLGVLQPWPLPLIKARFPRNQAAMIKSPHPAPLATLLKRVREQYREMPGLTLTKPHAMLLFGVAPSVCAAMLRALVMENFLSRTGDGLFVRSTTHHQERAHNDDVRGVLVGES
jgi:hypothetical protein